MRVWLEPATMGLIDHLGVSSRDAETIRSFAKRSSPFGAIWAGDSLAGLAGTVPGSLLSDSAYLWLHTTPIVQGHRIALGRLARRELRRFIAPYAVVFGHCTSGAHARRWVESLGGQFTSDGISFQITRT